MKNTLFIINLLALCLLLGCSGKITPPQIQSIKQFNINEIENGFIYANVQLSVYNPNKVPIHVERTLLDILDVSGHPLGAVLTSSPFEVKGKKTQVLNLALRMDVANTIKYLAVQQDSLYIRIVGDMQASVYKFTRAEHVDITVPIDISQKSISDRLFQLFSQSLTNSKLLQIDNVSFQKISLTEIQMLIDFSFNNDNAVQASLLDYSSSLYLFDKTAGSGKLKAPIMLNPNEKIAKGQLVFTLNNLKTIPALINKDILNGEVPIATKGNLKIKILNRIVTYPFNYQGKITINPANILKIE